MTADDAEARLAGLLAEVRACTTCAAYLPLGPRPVVQIGRSARVLIIGQAPGTKVHATGIPWNDASGDRLRGWLNVDRATFYDTARVAIMPMGFCYPGKGVSGDLAPRPECAPLWHERLLQHLPHLRLTLLVGHYAVSRYLGAQALPRLTDTVRQWRDHVGLGFVPLVHPSPRNRLWLNRNPWFERDVVPDVQQRISAILTEI